MNKLTKQIVIGICLLLGTFNLSAQEGIKLHGRVFNAANRQPLVNAQVSSLDATKSVLTNAEGEFTLEVNNKNAFLIVRADGFLQTEVLPVAGDKTNIYLLPENTYMHAYGYTDMNGFNISSNKTGTSQTVKGTDLNHVFNTPDEGMHGKFAGLRVMSKGGMPGEGAAMQLRGIKSFSGVNAPMIIIDGMPFTPNYSTSPTISGFSKSIFMPVNMKEVVNMTLLKGADAAVYGSLGSNGVLLIETEKATDLETKIDFLTTEGVSFVNKRIPMLKSVASKSYFGDIGENRYSNPEKLVELLPFLKDDPEDLRNYMYRNETDWQDEIYTPAFLSENILKIKGGDAIAKYMITLGTQQNKGTIDNTKMNKYLARMNADITFSPKLSTPVTVALNYSDFQLQEQGMISQTNPMLAALYQAPFFNVHKQAYNIDGTIETLPFYNTVDSVLGVSNPAAIVSQLDARSRSFDVTVNMGLNYRPQPWLKVDGLFGLFYTYTKDDMFVPGKDNRTIAPVGNSYADNTVRSGVYEGRNYYARGRVEYHRLYDNKHQVNVAAAFQMLTTKSEYDKASGVNTSTDFYNTLNRVTYDRQIVGESDEWNWMNYSLNADYNYNRELYLSATATIDGATSYGRNSSGWFIFPAIKGAWKAHQNTALRSSKFISNLTVRSEFSINPNSRFSSRFGKYAYQADPFMNVTGIYRTGLPNTRLKPEEVWNTGVGVDFGVIGNRLNLTVDLFQEQSKNMVIANTQSAIYGYDHRYDNDGEVLTRGVELGLSASVLTAKDWHWTLGGNITHFNSEVKKLGNSDSRTIDFSDGAQLLVEVGKSPYLFYGNRAEKIFTTTQEANNSNYRAHNGERFVAGDVKFFDANDDRVINDLDRVVLGDPTPDFYGSLYSMLQYKNFGLLMNFSYSYGNDVYNAVRRSTGSMINFNNQDASVARRWMIDGQETDIPRASYGDRTGNSRFSSRWIEDGSYFRLKEVTLSYDTDRKIGFINAARIYLTGINLLTFTDYLGMDPEFSYSYDPLYYGMDLGKAPLPKTVQLGVTLSF